MMERLLNVATPLTADCVTVPLSVPGPPEVGVPDVIASVTGAVLAVSTTPSLSSTCTVTAGEMVAPAAAFVGWVPNFRDKLVWGHKTFAVKIGGPGSYAQT